jgi:hypothetical protein
MNFLAHIYLSGDNDLIKMAISWLMGSGNNLKLSCGCSERNYLHRAIDTFTHPVF